MDENTKTALKSIMAVLCKHISWDDSLGQDAKNVLLDELIVSFYHVDKEMMNDKQIKYAIEVMERKG